MWAKVKANVDAVVVGLIPTVLHFVLHITGLVHVAKMIIWLADRPAPVPVAGK